MMAHDFAKTVEKLSPITNKEPNNLSRKNRSVKTRLNDNTVIKGTYTNAQIAETLSMHMKRFAKLVDMKLEEDILQALFMTLLYY